jgi:hypothetical protein
VKRSISELLSSKGLGKKTQDLREEPTLLPTNDTLIEEALSGDMKDSPPAQPQVGEQQPAAKETILASFAPDRHESRTEDPLQAGHRVKTDGDNFEPFIEDDDAEKPSIKRSKKFNLIVFGGTAIVFAGIAYLGYSQMEAQSQEEQQMASIKAKEPKIIHGKVALSPVSTTVSSPMLVATPAAASLNPKSIQAEMSGASSTDENTPTPQSAQKTAVIETPKRPAARATPPPTSSTSAYLRWADSQIHQPGGPREPAVPESALSNTPPSGPGLSGQSYGGGSTSSSSYVPPAEPLEPRYHRRAFGLEIPGAETQQQSKPRADRGERPAWAAYQPSTPIRPTAAATVTDKTPPPYQVLRVATHDGVSFAYVIKNGDIVTGRWATYGHRFSSGWILGKIDGNKREASFTAPQGYSVNVGVE